MLARMSVRRVGKVNREFVPKSASKIPPASGPRGSAGGESGVDTPGVGPIGSPRRRSRVPLGNPGDDHPGADGVPFHGVRLMSQRRARGNAAPARKPEPEKPKANPPLFRVRSGSLKVSVWKNEGEYGAMYSAKIVSVYKDKSDEWQETGSIDGRDLPALALACQEAFAEILADRGQGIEDGSPKDPDGDGDGDDDGRNLPPM